MSLEKKACRAAVIQALRFHFYMRPRDIAKLMKMPRQAVANMTVTPDTTVLQWYERRYQAEAIAAALKILEE